MGYESDESVAAKLLLFIDNDGDLYRQQFMPIIENLARKIKRGVYAPTLAIKLWMYLMDVGAKKYIKEFGGLDEEQTTSWNEAFPKRVREIAAKEISEREYEKIMNGEYNDYLNSKNIHLGKKGEDKAVTHLSRAIAQLEKERSQLSEEDKSIVEAFVDKSYGMNDCFLSNTVELRFNRKRNFQGAQTILAFWTMERKRLIKIIPDAAQDPLAQEALQYLQKLVLVDLA